MKIRRSPRLEKYDYSTPGAYFITICAQEKGNVFSNVKAEVGAGLAPPEIKYTAYGKIAKQQLEKLPQRYSNLRIDKYAIMPDHIHVMLTLCESEGGASPSPTISDIVCAYKSLTTRECNKIKPTKKLFQRSFYDRVIRNEKDFFETLKYIETNPYQGFERK